MARKVLLGLNLVSVILVLGRRCCNGRFLLSSEHHSILGSSSHVKFGGELFQRITLVNW
jgi:hypothetical protein